MDRNILQFGQIHFKIWTNTFANLNKYICQLRQIYSTTPAVSAIAVTGWFVWTNTVWNLKTKNTVWKNILANLNKYIWELKKYIYLFGEKHLHLWQRVRELQQDGLFGQIIVWNLKKKKIFGISDKYSFAYLATSARAATVWLVYLVYLVYLVFQTNTFCISGTECCNRMVGWQLSATHFGEIYWLIWTNIFWQFQKINSAIWRNTFCNSGCECCNRMVGWQLSATRGRRQNQNLPLFAKW